MGGGNKEFIGEREKAKDMRNKVLLVFLITTKICNVPGLNRAELQSGLSKAWQDGFTPNT